MQYYLAKLGISLGYKIWIARNDHKREWNKQKIGEFSISKLIIDNISLSVKDTISLIDVLWIDIDNKIISAFEVEKSTSIYSGILRLQDLSSSLADQNCNFYLVAPNKREKEIKAQLLRPSFQHNEMCSISYILFSDLRYDCEAMCKFGEDITVLDKISHTYKLIY
jgi:type II restriction enzyme